ncbi:hypothetical protein BUALT_Bualt06G0008600 [Buddleja alternifolia]|uniref:LOB domain-containing protein n=1 Tax=Buddleja alternifolia TaxID=168488 RepID=A0AAV6XK34_9LAMI|nr:hypothetical protein BUALT_Bualt06G0008600 [Buddleja alternifolia]
MASSSNSPCAACKFLRRKCQPDCGFAPYFPADQPHKFVNVHKVFGASNVTKLLNELQPHHREDAVNSLAYEADMRLRDPVYGCVGVISLLQHQLRQLQMDLTCATSQLTNYHNIGISAAAAHHQGINLLGGGVPTRHHDALFPVNQGYDGNNLDAINMSASTYLWYHNIGISAAAAAAAAHHQGINLLGGGAATRHHDALFPVNQGFDHRGGDGYDGNNLDAMNMSASIGQLNGFKQSRSPGAAADGRRTLVEPS